MNKQNFKNGLNKFPVSTDALDFMQEQINFVATLTDALGANVIIKQSSSSIPGLVVVNGELLPLQGTPQGYITIQEESQSLTAKGETFANARIIRIAKYTSNSYGSSSFKAEDFAQIDNVAALTLNQRQYVPKGTIIDWYGEAAFDNIPYGWVPCGGFFRTNGGTYQGNGSVPAAIIAEQNKWKQRYSDLESKVVFYYGPNVSYLMLTKVGDMSIPNLSGRFIVGAGYPDNTSVGLYNCGEIGGEKEHRLTANESGLPAHTHSVIGKTEDSVAVWGEGNGDIAGAGNGVVNPVNISGTAQPNEAKNALSAHENRPPYFALYKLIKVI